MSRPEGTRPPDLYYDETEAAKYDQSSRIINIQAELSARAIEMLAFDDDKPKYILDIGCGSGLSGQALEEAGHYWIGCDISTSMLQVDNYNTHHFTLLILNNVCINRLHLKESQKQAIYFI